MFLSDAAELHHVGDHVVTTLQLSQPWQGEGGSAAMLWRRVESDKIQPKCLKYEDEAALARTMTICELG